MSACPQRLAAVLFLLATSSLAFGQAKDKPDPAKEQVVVTEGVGKTPEDALKDAYRAAVREVVGAVVVQEERSKNDKIISEQLLTASNAYVSSHKKLSQTEENGLFRVTIEARVERAVLVDKLRTMKITLRSIKEGSIIPKEEDRRFSNEKIKAMSKEEMIANKTEIIHDALTDLPKVLEARARTPDRFDFDADSSTLQVNVTVAADSERYVQFLKRLQMRLDKLSVGKSIATAEGVAQDLDWAGAKGKVRGFHSRSLGGLWGPEFANQSDVWCLWMLTDVLNGGKTTRWTGYTLDADVRKCVSGLHGELKVLVSLLDAEGATLTEETINLKGTWLGEVVQRKKKAADYYGGGQASILKPTTDAVSVTQTKSVNVYLAPCEFTLSLSTAAPSSLMDYALERPFSLKMKIGKEEVKRVKDIRCAVMFRPAK